MNCYDSVPVRRTGLLQIAATIVLLAAISLVPACAADDETDRHAEGGETLANVSFDPLLGPEVSVDGDVIVAGGSRSDRERLAAGLSVVASAEASADRYLRAMRAASVLDLIAVGVSLVGSGFLYSSWFTDAEYSPYLVPGLAAAAIAVELGAAVPRRIGYRHLLEAVASYNDNVLRSRGR